MHGRKALVKLCRESADVDVIENACSALANLTWQHERNALAIGRTGGIEVLVDLCNSRSLFGSLYLDLSSLWQLVFRSQLTYHLNFCARRAHMHKHTHARARAHTHTHNPVLGPRTAEWDSNNRIQANAGEALVNATRNDSHENAERIRKHGVKPLVLLCASENLAVQRCSALVLGNVAQSDVNR